MVTFSPWLVCLPAGLKTTNNGGELEADPPSEPREPDVGGPEGRVAGEDAVPGGQL